MRRNIWQMFIKIKEVWKCEMTGADKSYLRRTHGGMECSPFRGEVGPSIDRPYPKTGAGMSRVGIPGSFSPAIATGSQRLPSEKRGIRIHIAQPRGTVHIWATGEIRSRMSSTCTVPRANIPRGVRCGSAFFSFFPFLL